MKAQMPLASSHLTRRPSTARQLLSAFTPPLLHLLQIVFLSRMNQIPMEGSISASILQVPIHVDSFLDSGFDHNSEASLAFPRPMVNADLGLPTFKLRSFFELLAFLAGTLGTWTLLGQLRIANDKQTSLVSYRFMKSCVVFAGVLFVALHIALYTTDHTKKMLTKELMMMVGVMLITAAMYGAVISFVFLRRVWLPALAFISKFFSKPRERESRSPMHLKLRLHKRSLGISLCLCLLLFTTFFAATIPSMISISTLTAPSTPAFPFSSSFLSTITNNEQIDVCQVHNIGSLQPSVRAGLVWPEILPRRTMSFFAGSEECGGESERNFVRKSSRYVATTKEASKSEMRNLFGFSREKLSAGPPTTGGSFYVEASKIPREATVEIPEQYRSLHPTPGRFFSVYDRSTSELLVPTKCPGTSTAPTVILEDFRRNQMGHDFAATYPTRLHREYTNFSKEWPDKVAAKYVPLCNNVTWSRGAPIGRSGNIDSLCTMHWSISVDKNKSITLERVTMNIRSSATSAAHIVRIPPNHAPAYAIAASTFNVGPPASRVRKFAPIPCLPYEHVRLQLLSEAISVFCGDDEEYHTHPLFDYPAIGKKKPAAALKHSLATKLNAFTTTESGNPQSTFSPDKDPRNLLILVFDAVSRQEFQRSLPITMSFLKRYAYSVTPTSHHGLNDSITPTMAAQEWKGHTTIGHSTPRNLVPALAGNVMSDNRYDEPIVARWNIFNLLKEKYGKDAYTSMVSGTCGHSSDVLLGSTAMDRQNGFSRRGQSKLLGGAGGPLAFTDKDQFSAMCHIGYGGLEGSFHGPNSIVKRCIGKRHVHDHIFEYTEDLIFRTMINNRHNSEGYEEEPRNLGKHFLHMSYFMEGHEGSHSVLAGLDLSLYRFLRKLEVVYHYFENPKNVILLMSDHGNHMGPYFEWSSVGKAERTTPFLIFLGTPIALQNHNQQHTSSIVSSGSATTHYDLYVTLCDILKVDQALLTTRRALSFLHADWSKDLSKPDNPRNMRKTCADMGAQSSCVFSLCTARK